MDSEGIVYKRQVELINCDFDVQSEAMKINKLNVDIIRKIGVSSEYAFKNLQNDLKHCSYIVSHNIDFDYPILKNEFAKNNLLFKDEDKKFICTMKLGSTLMNNTKYPKLIELYKFLFEHDIFQLHNADADVLILSKCFRELLIREVRARK